VVDDPAGDFFQAVLQAWPKVAAVEMEGMGAASAIDALHAEGRQVGFIMIRSASDLPREVGAEASASGTRGTEERDMWKEYAANAAAAFALHVVRQTWPVPPR
jgi:nucleoside phosphorylase